MRTPFLIASVILLQGLGSNLRILRNARSCHRIDDKKLDPNATKFNQITILQKSLILRHQPSAIDTGAVAAAHIHDVEAAIETAANHRMTARDGAIHHGDRATRIPPN